VDKVKILRASLVLLISSCLSAQTSQLDLRHLKGILERQGFTGALQGKIHFSRIGRLKCGTETYDVIYHEWEQSNPPGARHAAYRILFIDKRDHYIGSYRVPEHPLSIAGQRVIRFNFPEQQGNTIICDTEGLPADIILNGEGSRLFK
jgi:hypothetical protein